MTAPRDSAGRLLPTGNCWCGCGESTESVAAFFNRGHDRKAEASVIQNEYGDLLEFMDQHGYGPGGDKNAIKLWKGKSRGKS